MADNITLNPGALGAQLRTDDIDGFQWQYVKLGFGPIGTATICDTANPIPVDLRADNLGGLEVVQAVAADLNCTEANSDAIKTAVEKIDDLQGALKSVDTDELITRITDSAGTEINPAKEDGNLASIKTAVELIDNPVSGNEMLIAGGATQANDVKVTLNSEVVAVDATGQGDVPVTLDSEVVAVDATGQGDVPVTLDGEEVTLAANDGVDIGNVDVTTLPSDVATEDGQAYGKGMLIQGDDGGDRRAVLVDEAGHPIVRLIDSGGDEIEVDSGRLQVDISAQSVGNITVDLNAQTVGDITVDLNAQSLGNLAVDLNAQSLGDLAVTLDSEVVAVDATGQGDVPVTLDSEVVAVDATGQGDVPVTLDGEEVISGTADNFKCDANVQVSDVDASATNPLPTQAQLQSSHVYDGMTRSEIKHFCVVGTTNGENTLIGAVADKKFRVLSMSIMPMSATEAQLYVHNDDNYVVANNVNKLPVALDADADNSPGFVLPWNPGGWFETDANNEALQSNQSSTAPVFYVGNYIEIA